MISFFASKFEKLVVRYFEPKVKQVGLKLTKVTQGVFEVRGTSFIVRVRLGTGHKTDFLVTLSQDLTKQDLSDLTGEIGLGVIAEFYKKPLCAQCFDSDEQIDRAFKEAADATEALCFPYLLGIRDSVGDLREFIEEKIVSSGVRTKKYNFPPNVREEWL